MKLNRYEYKKIIESAISSCEANRFIGTVDFIRFSISILLLEKIHSANNQLDALDI
tara:strand:+ start:702 stop:869 length:168 start_codon:yes stop_codon:yes gene_type:complete